MFTPVLVTPPAELPVTLDEAKLWARVDGNDDDPIMEELIAAAVAYLDGYSGILGRAIVTQTWRDEFDGLCRQLRLRMPATSIASVKWRDVTGTLSTIDPANYALQVDTLGNYVRFADTYAFPIGLASLRGAVVEYVAGYGGAAAVPADLKVAIKQLVTVWYEDRSLTGTVPNAVANSLSKYRIWSI